MQLNANFSKRVALHGAELPWKASPMKGVDRRMFDRIGDEVARATSIVRYAPGSQFSAHVHTGGEEFLVLEGVFQDEHGDYPVGSYVRNPPASSHTPGSAPGCTIFVKLWQFDPSDRQHVRIDTSQRAFEADPARAGVEVMPLYREESEDVRLERWSAGKRIQLDASGGLELLVLDGGFTEAGDTFASYSWLRLPKAGDTAVEVGADGAKVWLKSGHLRSEPEAPAV